MTVQSSHVQQVSQNQPKHFIWAFSVLHHPNHFILTGVNNTNIIIT